MKNILPLAASLFLVATSIHRHVTVSRIKAPHWALLVAAFLLAALRPTFAGNVSDFSGGIAIGTVYAGVNAPTDGMIVQGAVGIGTTSSLNRQLSLGGATAAVISLTKTNATAKNWYLSNNLATTNAFAI